MNLKTVATWVLCVPLAFFMIGGGAAKLAGDAAMVELFRDIGVGQWFRYVVGSLEILGGLGLFVARVRTLAATGLVLLLACATVVNLAVIDASPWVSGGLAVLAAGVIVVGRADRLPRGVS